MEGQQQDTSKTVKELQERNNFLAAKLDRLNQAMMNDKLRVTGLPENVKDDVGTKIPGINPNQRQAEVEHFGRCQ